MSNWPLIVRSFFKWSHSRDRVDEARGRVVERGGIMKKTFQGTIDDMVNACGSDQPGSCEYALDDKGLVFRARGEELRFAWQNATQVLDTEDAIEVIMQPTAIARIPKRIFKDAGELQEWRACIKRHIHDGPSRQDA